MKEVLLTVQVACSELADMRLLLHSLMTCLPAGMQQKHLSQQADQGMSAEQPHRPEEAPSRVEAKSATSDQAHSSLVAVEQLQQKADKWKARCHDLQRELAALSVEAAARDAALQVILSYMARVPLSSLQRLRSLQMSHTNISAPVVKDVLPVSDI